MAANIWGNVGGVNFALPMETLLGTSNQLLGMNGAADKLQYKNVTFDNTAGLLAVPAAVTSGYSFTGDLDTFMYQDGADIFAWKTAGTRRARLSVSGLVAEVPIQLLGTLLKEDKSADIAAAATTDLGTATGNYVVVTNAAGNTTITDLGGATLPAGTEIESKFSITGGSVTITHNAVSLILLGGGNITLVDKDVVRWRKINDASAYWEMVGFQRGVSTSGISNPGDLIVGELSGGITIPGIQSIGSPGQALHVAETTDNNRIVWFDNPSRPNLLINPNWQIDQINEGALYTSTGGGTQGPDGWTLVSIGAGVFKLRTLADPENAALKCLEITCTTADVSIAASDSYNIYTAVEGYDAAGLQFGTASAQSLTIQFKFKSNITGVYGVALHNSALNRSYIGTITVPNTSENEYSVTLTADTSGTWLYTNGSGFYLRLTLAAGSDSQNTAGVWAANDDTITSSQANFMSSTSNIAYLKRIQLIPGALVQAYKPADIQAELAKAQRYYEKSYNQGVAVGTVTPIGQQYVVYNAGIAQYVSSPQFRVTKRSVPTFVGWRADTGAIGKWVEVVTGDSVPTVSEISTYGMPYVSLSGGGVTAGIGHWSANARLS